MTDAVGRKECLFIFDKDDIQDEFFVETVEYEYVMKWKRWFRCRIYGDMPRYLGNFHESSRELDACCNMDGYISYKGSFDAMIYVLEASVCRIMVVNREYVPQHTQIIEDRSLVNVISPGFTDAVDYFNEKFFTNALHVTYDLCNDRSLFEYSFPSSDNEVRMLKIRCMTHAV